MTAINPPSTNPRPAIVTGISDRALINGRIMKRSGSGSAYPKPRDMRIIRRAWVTHASSVRMIPSARTFLPFLNSENAFWNCIADSRIVENGILSINENIHEFWRNNTETPVKMTIRTMRANTGRMDAKRDE
jgi:hypothetical protein